MNTMDKKTMSAAARLCVAAILAAAPALAQKTISPPVFGANTPGDDYFLANYTQLLDYWNKVAKESDRIRLEEIGKTAEGRPIVMAIITAPANFKNLARYKEISQRLARAEGLTDEQAHALAAEGIFAFFLESGFLAVLLFGWDRVGPKLHFFATCMVALGAHFSAVWIILPES